MKLSAKIGYGFIAFLLLSALIICFLLNVWLGIFIVLLIVFSFWFAYRGKGETDAAIAAAARELGLDYIKNILRYGQMSGNYKGCDVFISIEGGGSWQGTPTAFTRITSEFTRDLGSRRTLKRGDWKITVKNNRVRADIPFICVTPDGLRECLDKIVEITAK